MDTFDWIWMGAKVGILLLVLLQLVPMMVWVERRGSALMQNRLGPNRVGPFGLLQSLADAVKFIFKEDRAPGHVNKFYWFIAPLISVIPAFMTFAVIPIADTLDWGGRHLSFAAADLNVGIIYILSIGSLGIYGVIMAGWASNNKYSLLGSLRSSAQMISYELAMGLSVAALLLVYSSPKLGDIARAQGETLLQLGPVAIPKWGIFVQPLGFILFLTAVFAETNRLPFDLPEGESEIVAGYHLEYGSMKFALFMMAEYLHMTTASGLLATLYFGGWQLLPGMEWLLQIIGNATGLDPDGMGLVRAGAQVASFTLKIVFFLWFFVWVRWTLPRFRFDQLMTLGWKVLLPLALLNVVGTATLVYLGII